VVEVTDAGWQAALEAVLRPYRHLILLEREQDRHAAWALGERARFRHFIVSERETAGVPRAWLAGRSGALRGTGTALAGRPAGPHAARR
jgi:hypothetical protein